MTIPQFRRLVFFLLTLFVLTPISLVRAHGEPVIAIQPAIAPAGGQCWAGNGPRTKWRVARTRPHQTFRSDRWCRCDCTRKPGIWHMAGSQANMRGFRSITR